MPESSITEKAMFGVPWITGKSEPSGYSGRIPEGPWKAVINDYPLSADLLVGRIQVEGEKCWHHFNCSKGQVEEVIRSYLRKWRKENIQKILRNREHSCLGEILPCGCNDYV